MSDPEPTDDNTGEKRAPVTRRPSSARRTVPSQQQPATNQQAASNASNNAASSNVVRRRTPSTNTVQNASSPKQVKTLWDAIKDLQQKRAKETTATVNSSKEPTETNVLLVGPEGCGKTSLIYRLIQKDFRKEPPSPTVGLEYRFRKKEDNFRSFIAHFWELAGGRVLTNLLDDLITPDNIHTFVVVIVLDLSCPQRCYSDLVFYLNKVKSVSDNCFKIMKQHNSDFPDKMVSRQQKKFGEKHADLKTIDFFGIQTVICATHFEKFKMKPPSQLTAMNQTLRYIAHKYACSLIYMVNLSTDTGGDAVENFKTNDMFDRSFRSLMAYYIFGSAEKQPKSIEKLKPIRVLSGRDSFQEIGKPTISAKNMDIVELKNNFKKITETCMSSIKQSDIAALESWYGLFFDQFGKDDAQEKEYTLFDTLAEQYKEPNIDSIRIQKDEELLNYRRMIERERQKKVEMSTASKQKAPAVVVRQ